MTLQLRQICLVARQLEPVLADLTGILGIERCHVDPAVGKFGLENTLMPIGRNFLEVVAPIRPGTTAGRYLERRGGDGGYMVITQADTRAHQQAVRRRALDAGVRVAYESDRDGWGLCQLHPGDMVAAFLEIEWDAQEDLQGRWHPAGGSGWIAQVRQDVTVDLLGVELQGPDPEALAQRWAQVIGVPVVREGGGPAVRLNNAVLRFVEATDGRGPGLGGVDILVADPARILDAAKARRCPVTEGRVDIGGTRWYLHERGA